MSNTTDLKQLELLKKNIESLEKLQQIEILKIINNTQSNILNENKNGIYINMSSLSENTIDELKLYRIFILKKENLTPMKN